MECESLVSDLVDSEEKIFDISGTPVLDQTGSVILLNGTVAGTGLNQRIGRTIFMKSIALHVYAQSTAVTGVEQAARVMVVYDHQANGAQPAISDVLSSAIHNQHYNVYTRNRFVVIFDEWFTLSASAGLVDSKAVLRICGEVNRQTMYGNTGFGDVRDISTGALYLITIGSEVAGATAGIAPFRARLTFDD